MGGPRLYTPWMPRYDDSFYDPYFQPAPDFFPPEPEPGPPSSPRGFDRLTDWTSGKTRNPPSEWPAWWKERLFQSPPSGAWETTLADARAFTPSSADDFPETGLGIVDNRNWSWQNLFENIGNSALGQSAGVQALAPGGQEDAMLMLELQAENQRINAERNRMRRDEVGTPRYVWDLVNPAVSVAVAGGLPVGTFVRGAGLVTSGLAKAMPNVFRNAGPRFIANYFPQPTSAFGRFAYGVGERLTPVWAMNDIVGSEPGRGFRTAVPWVGGAIGYSGVTLGVRALQRVRALRAIRGQGKIVDGVPVVERAPISDMAEAIGGYDQALNRFLPNLAGGAFGGYGGSTLGDRLIVDHMDKRDLLNERPPVPVMVENPDLYRYEPSRTRGW